MLLKIEKDPFHLCVVKKMPNRNLLRIIEKDMNSEYKNKWVVLSQMTLNLNPLDLNHLIINLDQLLHKKVIINEIIVKLMLINIIHLKFSSKIN